MNRQALEQVRTQLRGYVTYSQPPTLAGLWSWESGPYTSKTGFPSEAVAKEDFRVFLQSDLQLELKAKSGGRKDSVKALQVNIRKRSRGNRYPDEILEFADQFKGSAKQRAVSACTHAQTVGVIGSVDSRLIQLVENDISYYEQKAA